MLFGLCLVGTLSAFGFVFAPSIIGVFQKSKAVIDIGTPAIRYACVGLLFMSLTVPINMLYQSIRKAGIASFLSLLRSGAMLIPAIILGTHFLGLDGIRLAQPIADALTGVVCLPFIIHFLKFGGNNEK